jgi:mitogen-activated protein kinase kinase
MVILAHREAQEREPFVQAAKRTPVDLEEWAVGLMEKHNRKSHLAPQLSPATQELLRGGDSPTDSSQDYSRTPTSGEIPIGGGSAIISPREQVINTINSARSPNANTNGGIGSIGRTTIHPGPRQITANSVPAKSTSFNMLEHGSGASSSNAGQFMTLPMRPAPPASQLPPPPVPRKENSDIDGKRENRRQATFGVPPSSNIYGSGY